jgi:hypothetical protein
LGRAELVVLEVQGGLTRELNLIRGKDRSLSRAAQVLMTHVRARVVESMNPLSPGKLGARGVPRGAGVETA